LDIFFLTAAKVCNIILTEGDLMGKFDGILICTDLDATFLHQAKASEENCKAIKYFQENGGYFTVCTGRSHKFVRDFDNYKPNAPLIVSNGTLICHHETGVILDYIEMPEETARVIDEIAASPLSDKIFLYDLADGGTHMTAADMRRWDITMAEKPSERFGKVPGPWLKMLLQQKTPEDNAEMQRLIHRKWPGMFATSRSYSIGLELHSPDGGKGACVDRLRRLMPDIKLVVGAGDYENDISLVQHADIGYAVANALPEVKAAADRITVECTQHAIAQIISDIEREFT